MSLLGTFRQLIGRPAAHLPAPRVRKPVRPALRQDGAAAWLAARKSGRLDIPSDVHDRAALGSVLAGAARSRPDGAGLQRHDGQRFDVPAGARSPGRAHHSLRGQRVLVRILGSGSARLRRHGAGCVVGPARGVLRHGQGHDASDPSVGRRHGVRRGLDRVSAGRAHRSRGVSAHAPGRRAPAEGRWVTDLRHRRPDERGSLSGSVRRDRGASNGSAVSAARTARRARAPRRSTDAARAARQSSTPWRMAARRTALALRRHSGRSDHGFTIDRGGGDAHARVARLVFTTG